MDFDGFFLLLSLSHSPSQFLFLLDPGFFFAGFLLPISTFHGFLPFFDATRHYPLLPGIVPMSSITDRCFSPRRVVTVGKHRALHERKNNALSWKMWIQTRVPEYHVAPSTSTLVGIKLIFEIKFYFYFYSSFLKLLKDITFQTLVQQNVNMLHWIDGKYCTTRTWNSSLLCRLRRQ